MASRKGMEKLIYASVWFLLVLRGKLCKLINLSGNYFTYLGGDV